MADKEDKLGSGLLEKARKLLKLREKETKQRLKDIFSNGETKDDDSQRPQGKDVRR